MTAQNKKISKTFQETPKNKNDNSDQKEKQAKKMSGSTKTSPK